MNDKDIRIRVGIFVYFSNLYDDIYVPLSHAATARVGAFRSKRAAMIYGWKLWTTHETE